MIADTVRMSERLGVQIWLRGGWAMDFFLGQVTREHVDIDFMAWIDDAPAITAALDADGYQTITGPPPDQGRVVALCWFDIRQHGGRGWGGARGQSTP